MGEIIITLENDDRKYQYEDFGLTFDSNPGEILDAVKGAVLEEFGVNIQDENENYLFTVRKIEKTGNSFIYPKSTAG